MAHEINDTHDPDLRSWVESADDPATDFPIQNLPLCRFRVDDGHAARLGTRIGDRIIAIDGLVRALGEHPDASPDELIAGAFTGDPAPAGWGEVHRTASACRGALSRLLRIDAGLTNDQVAAIHGAAHGVDEVELTTPGPIGDYTDFYASVFHATNVGSMFRPGNALLPNYKHIPIAYHGRASSIVPSGATVRRPTGQLPPPEEGAGPGFGPCKLLDYELEVGMVVGRANELGEPVSIGDAEDHLLGICLVNDWSARDMQKWEYQPLGPFLAKSFATTVSAYVVTFEALAPFRAPAYERPAGDPRPLGYLTSAQNTSSGGIDLTLAVHLSSAAMRKQGMDPVRLSTASFRDMYWTTAQMLAHHSSNGCNLRPGDLLASGTVSGPERSARGSLLELTWDGDPWVDPPKLVPGTQRTPLALPTGEERRFLADGDEVIVSGWCEREGMRRIGLGECRGIVAPARAM